MVAFLFSAIAVSLVVLFTQSFRLLSFVIDNSGSLTVFLQLMGLMIPTFLPLIVPISVGIAVLFVYHKLTIDSELVVLRAAGFSSFRIALPVLTLAAFSIVLGIILTLWVTPAANRTLVSLQYKVRDEYSAFMIKPGTFNDLAEGLTFFARKRGRNGGLEDILVHDVRNPHKPVTIMAETGQFSVENNLPQAIVFNGRRQEIDLETGRLQELIFDRYALDLHLLKSEKQTRQPDPRELSINDLLRAQTNTGITNKSAGKIRAELHQRIAGPLLSFAFALIGVTLMLVGDFNRRGMSRRVFGAALSIIIVQASMIGLVSQISKMAWVVPVLYAVILLPVPVCFYLLWERKRPTTTKGAA